MTTGLVRLPAPFEDCSLGGRPSINPESRSKPLSEMTTITFEVPTETLRKAEFAYSAEEYKTLNRGLGDKCTPRNAMDYLAFAALLEAKEALPPPSKPVTKDTPNGTRVTHRNDLTWRGLRFIGLHPGDPQHFWASDPDEDSFLLSTCDFVEVPDDACDGDAEPEFEPEPEPERVPVEVGQVRLLPITVAAVDGRWARITFPDPIRDEWTCRTSDVEQWGVAE